MEKQNAYPDTPAYQKMSDSDVPRNYYNHSHPIAPSNTMTGLSQESVPIQSQQAHQPQPMMIQNLPPIPPLGPQPCLVACPFCHYQQMSNVRMESATKTHLFAALFCLVGLCCCVWVPYVVDSCKNANHYCSHCDAYLGVYDK